MFAFLFGCRKQVIFQNERTFRILCRFSWQFISQVISLIIVVRNRFKAPSIFILTVPRRYFCCGSLLFLLSVFILWFIYYVSDIFCKF